MRVGHDGRVDPIRTVQVELLDRQRDAVARVETIKAPAQLRAAGDCRELKAGMAPEQVCRQSPRKPGGPGDDHPWGILAVELPRDLLYDGVRTGRARLSHAAHP